jgi:hypothetical protein
MSTAAERLMDALEPAGRTALLVCLRVLERSACKYAIAGELALRLRGVGQGRAGRVEIAVAGLDQLPRAQLEAAGLEVWLEHCRAGKTVIFFRATRPAALARAERFGRLPVLGTADVLSDLLGDACDEGTPAARRRELATQLEHLWLVDHKIFADVENAGERLARVREQSFRIEPTIEKEEPMRAEKTSTLDKLATIAKAVIKLMPVLLPLVAGCDGGAGQGDGADGGTWCCSSDTAGTCGTLVPPGTEWATIHPGQQTLVCTGEFGTFVSPSCGVIAPTDGRPGALCTYDGFHVGMCDGTNDLTCSPAVCANIPAQSRAGASCTTDGINTGYCGDANNLTCIPAKDYSPSQAQP